MNIGDLFETVIALERNLADFYQALGRSERLRSFADIFSYMADHSARHADQIQDWALTADLPPLDIDPLQALQQRLKTSLRQQIESDTDARRILERLAQAEEIVGQMYQSLAQHFHKKAARNHEIAAQFEQLAREERDHRDYILAPSEA
jgi:rubrerythrin